VTRSEARDLYSDYLDKTLGDDERARLLAFWDADPTARAEFDAFARTLSVLYALPAREPSLDLWREFAPHLAAHRAERKLSLPARARHRWHQFCSEFSAGLILWTHSLASRTHARLERYLLRDPLARNR